MGEASGRGLDAVTGEASRRRFSAETGNMNMVAQGLSRASVEQKGDHDLLQSELPVPLKPNLHPKKSDFATIRIAMIIFGDLPLRGISLSIFYD